jgi:uncharacterized protein (DUF849 family)
MLILACLNGSREPGTHPALPLTPPDLAREAVRAVQAGAGALHVHPRDAAGQQTLAPAVVATVLDALHTACPGIPVGTTTITFAEPDLARRLALVRSWTVRPDFVSVNFFEDGAEELCATLLELGMVVEVAVARVEDVQRLVSAGMAERCLRVLIEVFAQDAAAMFETADTLIAALDAAGVAIPRLLHGYEASTWPILRAAITRGYDVRIGLEDTYRLPDGGAATDNAQLVALAKQYATADV